MKPEHLDAARLDALEILRMSGVHRVGGPFKYEGSRLVIEVRAGETIRDALDALMEEQSEGEKR